LKLEKIELLKLILETENEAVVQGIKNVFKRKELQFLA